MPEATITTRRFRKEDVAEVLQLLKASLGETALLKRTPELFTWKHLANPFGESIVLLAESAGEVVGLRAFMRWELEDPNGRRLRCVRAVDTATHPRFQRQGIFRRLTEEAVEEARNEEVDLVFNTPNVKSGRGYLSMGWSEVGSIGVLARPTRSVLRRGGVSERSSEYVDGPSFVPSPPLPDDRSPIGLRTPRTPAYQMWRFGSHPTARYVRIDTRDSTVVARGNLRGTKREALITDVYGDRPSSAIRQTVRRSRASYVATWFSPRTPERSAALRCAFLPVPGVTALTLMARPLRGLDIDVFSMSSWDLALSDLELL